MECSYTIQSLATVGLLALGSAIGFTVLVMFAVRRGKSFLQAQWGETASP